MSIYSESVQSVGVGYGLPNASRSSILATTSCHPFPPLLLHRLFFAMDVISQVKDREIPKIIDPSGWLFVMIDPHKGFSQMVTSFDLMAL